MDKKKLAEAFRVSLETELMAIKEAARATYEAATHEEAKPENEYDTRAIEASYLAGAQAKRAGEIDEILSLFLNLPMKTFSPKDPISATAYVVFEDDKGKKSHVLVMPKGGGFSVSCDGVSVKIVTPASRLGEALLDRRQGEDVDIEVGDEVHGYSILSVA